jgi:hypothetical protein
MTRFSLASAGAFALVAGASAQTLPQNSPLALTPEKITGAIKHAGIYHVSTGTWTRTGGAVANFGPDTIYSNTAGSGYFSPDGGNGAFAPGSTNYDEGNVPSSFNTNNAGNRDEYNVNCIEIGYCDLGTATSGWELSFYSSYTPCSVNTMPDATIDTGPAPAGGCWLVALDLSGGNEICLSADGGDGFDDVVDLDTFGWSFRYTGTGAGLAGFLIAGDPASTDPNYIPGGLPVDGTGTYFGPPSLCANGSTTGLLTRNFWWLEDPTGMDSNCYFFGTYSNNNGCGGPITNPYASWYMEIQADTGPCNSVFSQSNGCASNPNSTGVNSSMVVSGSPSVAADSVTLTATVTANSFGFFITSQDVGFVANPGGSQGNICLGANIGRFQNLAALSDGAGMIEISTTAGQWTLNNIPQGSGPYMAQVGGTAHFQCWHRDTDPMGMPSSNFTDGVVVTWQ